MTTIATDGKSMAGDTQQSNGHIFGFAVKVFRAPDGRIFGAAGPSADCRKFERWMMAGGDEPKVSDKFAGIILNLDGTVDWIDEDWELIRIMTPCALGSGEYYATGAMEAGATPEQAVAISMKRDTGTGGEITVLHLESAVRAVA